MVQIVPSGIEALDMARAVARDVRDLGRLLGIHVLENQQIIFEDLDRMHVPRLMAAVRTTAAALALDPWPAAVRQLDDASLAALARMTPDPELAVLAFLQGLCCGKGAIDRAFRDEWGDVRLRRGDVFPRPRGPHNTGSHRMPPDPWRTVNLRSNLGLGLPVQQQGDDPFGYDIYADARWPTVLVFTDKETLDDAVWLGERDPDGNLSAGRLPLVAAVFPCGWDQLALPARDVTDVDWFGVWPEDAAWDAAAVGRVLGEVVTHGDKQGTPCSIAVLPEVSLPHPGALAEVVQEGTGAHPRLVVAGSAHIATPDDEGDVVHSNASVVYLDGAVLMTHRKLHPFQTKQPEVLGEGYAGPRLPERLSLKGVELRVAAGQHTRLAVLICADALDVEIHRQLLALGVNLVLVPSLTIDDAGFEALVDVPNLNQGTVVIVNAALHPWAVACRPADATARLDAVAPTHDGHPFAIVFDPSDIAGTSAVVPVGD